MKKTSRRDRLYTTSVLYGIGTALGGLDSGLWLYLRTYPSSDMSWMHAVEIVAPHLPAMTTVVFVLAHFFLFIRGRLQHVVARIGVVTLICVFFDQASYALWVWRYDAVTATFKNFFVLLFALCFTALSVLLWRARSDTTGSQTS